MDYRGTKRRENRENLFSFGNLKNEPTKLNHNSFEYVKARVQTEPQAKYMNSYARQPLAPKNAYSILNISDQKTPSYNFNAIQDSFYRPTIPSQAPKCKCEMILVRQSRDISPYHNHQRYFYDPSVDDIKRKYGMNQKYLRTQRRESLDKISPGNYQIKPIRQYSQSKLQTKPQRQHTYFYENSFQRQRLSTNKFRDLEQITPNQFCYPPFNPEKHQFESKELIKQQNIDCYPSFSEQIFEEISDPQNTIDSINSLNAKINEKVNRLLNDEYLYY